MTVGSQVKACFSSIKSAEATMLILANKTQNEETIKALKEANQLLVEVKNDLKNQVIFLKREEPQY